jgi:hypothetical protein
VEAPQVTVAAPQVTVAAPPAPVNQITVEAPEPRPRAIRYEVESEINRFGAPTGKMTITPVYG